MIVSPLKKRKGDLNLIILAEDKLQFM